MTHVTSFKNRPTLRIGGVPEHFNTPWHLAIDSGAFDDLPIDVSWQDYHGGTGALTKALDAREIDAALVLTEGVLKYLAAGGPSKLVGTYVSSPLLWGIHVHADSDMHEVEDLERATWGISRKGSGSHLMSVVSASEKMWPIDKLSFQIVRSMRGAQEAMDENRNIAFMWEKFTTKPLVDAGHWRRVDTFAAPWPAFLFVISDHADEAFSAHLVDVLERVRRFCPGDDPHNPNFVEHVSMRYDQRPEDVQEWFVQTQWRSHCVLDKSRLSQALGSLNSLGLTDVQDKSASLDAWLHPVAAWST